MGHPCQQADQPGEESFKLGMTGERQNEPRSGEELVTQVGKERVWGGVDKTDLLKPTKLNQRRLTPSVYTQIRKCLQYSMQVEALVPYLENQHSWVPVCNTSTLTQPGERTGRITGLHAVIGQ